MTTRWTAESWGLTRVTFVRREARGPREQPAITVTLGVGRGSGRGGPCREDGVHDPAAGETTAPGQGFRTVGAGRFLKQRVPGAVGARWEPGILPARLGRQKPVGGWALPPQHPHPENRWPGYGQASLVPFGLNSRSVCWKSQYRLNWKKNKSIRVKVIGYPLSPHCNEAAFRVAFECPHSPPPPPPPPPHPRVCRISSWWENKTGWEVCLLSLHLLG